MDVEYFSWNFEVQNTVWTNLKCKKRKRSLKCGELNAQAPIPWRHKASAMTNQAFITEHVTSNWNSSYKYPPLKWDLQTVELTNRVLIHTILCFCLWAQENNIILQTVYHFKHIKKEITFSWQELKKRIIASPKVTLISRLSQLHPILESYDLVFWREELPIKSAFLTEVTWKKVKMLKHKHSLLQYIKDKIKWQSMSRVPPYISN